MRDGSEIYESFRHAHASSELLRSGWNGGNLLLIPHSGCGLNSTNYPKFLRKLLPSVEAVLDTITTFSDTGPGVITSANSLSYS